MQAYATQVAHRQQGLGLRREVSTGQCQSSNSLAVCSYDPQGDLLVRFADLSLPDEGSDSGTVPAKAALHLKLFPSASYPKGILKLLQTGNPTMSHLNFLSCRGPPPGWQCRWSRSAHWVLTIKASTSGEVAKSLLQYWSGLQDASCDWQALTRVPHTSMEVCTMMR